MSSIQRSGVICAPRRKLKRERGSVIFIVVMGMLLLTSLGTWVVYAGGIASSSAGYQRSASQALYLSELAILSGTAHLAQPGKVAEVLAAVESKGTDSCRSIPNQLPSDKCKVLTLADINAHVVANGASGYNLLDITAGGSFSPYAVTQEGFFFVELSGFRRAEVMGTDLASEGRYQQATINAYATLRPSSADFCAGAEGANSAATEVGMRAYSIIGPK